jgi:Domain of unknown function (DUF4082)/Abnormal spindle-like microcephaly-assoc'd, ASPM-SPD-2-Hydin/Immunoglobulin domain/Immunoglobulin I-set domain
MKAIQVGGKFLGAVLAVTSLLVFSFGTRAQTLAPVSSFWNSLVKPAFVTGNDSQSVELGMKFRSSIATSITAIRFYKATNSGGTHTGTIWTSTGVKLASVTFTGETASGWQTQQLAAPLAISAGMTYVVSYHTVEYVWNAPFFTQTLTVGSLTAPAHAGVYAYGKYVTFPTSTWEASNYWVDVVSQSSAPSAPSITSQPISRTITAGQTASFSISASGSTLSYQWKKSGTVISGATSSNYTTPATVLSDSGAQFACSVSNSAGSVTSNAATLSVNASAVAPSITSQPASRTVIAGQTASFSVSVSGTAPFTYQWMKNSAAISGATSTSYTTPVTVTSDNGAQFTVAASNSAGSVTSNAATLTVNAATLLLSVNPGSLSFGNVNVGSIASQQATLTNTGTGNVTLSGLSYSGAGFSASGVSSGQVLTPGQTAAINVTFQPSAAGSVSGSVTAASNASSSAVVTMSGSGVQLVSHSVALSWTRSTSTVNGYLVYNSQASGGPYTRLTASSVNLPSYADSSVQNGKTYYYVVTAVDASGVESQYSNQASAVIP